MKKFFITLASALLFVGTAFAQYVPAPRIIGQGYQGGSPNWGGAPPNAIYLRSGQTPPQGYCPWSGRALNVLGGALVGGVIGALAGDSGRAAGQGAAIGALTGVFIPCEQPTAVSPQFGQRVIQDSPTQISHQVIERRQSIATCKIDTGEVIYRFNQVAGKRIGPNECNQYLQKQVPLPEEKDMAIVP